MHVHLHEFQIPDDDDAIAERHQFFAQFFDVGKGGFLLDVDDEELRAVGKFDDA